VIEPIACMLQRAAAAGAIPAVRAEMDAGRLDAVRREDGEGHDHSMVLHLRDGGRFTRKREGDVDRAAGRFGNAVAAGAEARDSDRFRAHVFLPATTYS